MFFNFLHIFKHVPTKFQGAFVDVCPYFVSWLYVTRKDVYTEIVVLVYEKIFLLGKYLQYTIFFFWFSKKSWSVRPVEQQSKLEWPKWDQKEILTCKEAERNSRELSKIWRQPCCRKIKNGCLVLGVPSYVFILVCNEINETFNPAEVEILSQKLVISINPVLSQTFLFFQVSQKCCFKCSECMTLF